MKKGKKAYSLSKAHYKCYYIFEALYKNIKHFKTRTKCLSLEDMFWILQHSSSVQGCLQIFDCVYKADINKEGPIIKWKLNRPSTFYYSELLAVASDETRSKLWL